MAKNAPDTAAAAPKRWRVTLNKPAPLYGEWLSPKHPNIEVDDDGLAQLGDAVETKTEIVAG